MVYRVIIKVSYMEAHFDFEKGEDAVRFAVEAIEHSVPSEDVKRAVGVVVRKVDPTKTEEEDD